MREAEDDEGEISGARGAFTLGIQSSFILVHVWLSVGAVVELEQGSTLAERQSTRSPLSSLAFMLRMYGRTYEEVYALCDSKASRPRR